MTIWATRVGRLGDSNYWTFGPLWISVLGRGFLLASRLQRRFSLCQSVLERLWTLLKCVPKQLNTDNRLHYARLCGCSRRNASFLSGRLLFKCPVAVAQTSNPCRPNVHLKKSCRPNVCRPNVLSSKRPCTFSSSQHVFEVRYVTNFLSHRIPKTRRTLCNERVQSLRNFNTVLLQQFRQLQLFKNSPVFYRHTLGSPCLMAAATIKY